MGFHSGKWRTVAAATSIEMGHQRLRLKSNRRLSVVLFPANPLEMARTELATKSGWATDDFDRIHPILVDRHSADPALTLFVAHQAPAIDPKDNRSAQ